MKCYNLKEKVAIVTGASRGIGEAIATRLSNCGAKTILIARGADKLKIVQERIISQGSFAEIMIGDVSSLESFSQIISSINNFSVFNEFFVQLISVFDEFFTILFLEDH